MPFRERSLRVKNRMRVIRSSGSVRGEDGNILAYSAGRQPDVSANTQPLETRIAIDLDDSPETGQMGCRPFGPPVRAVEIYCRRRISSAPGPVIARIDPEPAGLGATATGIEHRNRGVVGEQLL
jgi:hypothetical protein